MSNESHIQFCPECKALLALIEEDTSALYTCSASCGYTKKIDETKTIIVSAEYHSSNKEFDMQSDEIESLISNMSLSRTKEYKCTYCKNDVNIYIRSKETLELQLICPKCKSLF